MHSILTAISQVKLGQPVAPYSQPVINLCNLSEVVKTVSVKSNQVRHTFRQVQGWKNHDCKKSKIRSFYLNQIFKKFFVNSYYCVAPKFYQIFETGLFTESQNQHGRHASAISSYNLAEQKVSKQQLKFH